MGLHVLLACALATTADARQVELPDLGLGFVAPDGWIEEPGGSDFETKDQSGQIEVTVNQTPFQVSVTSGTAEVAGQRVATLLRRAGADPVEVLRAVQVGDHLETDVAFERRGQARRRIAVDVPVRGATIHIVGTGPAVAVASLRSAIDAIVASLRVDWPADPLPDEVRALSPSEDASVPVPAGWRPPAAAEQARARVALEGFGADPDRCSIALRPDPMGTTTLFAACLDALRPGPIDSWSYAHEEAIARRRLFVAGTPVEAASPLRLPSRTGMLWTFDPRGPDAMAVALAPAGEASVVVRVLGPDDEAEAMQATARESLAGATLPAPAPLALSWLFYGWRHLPMLIICGFGAAMWAVGIVVVRLWPKPLWQRLGEEA